MPPTSDLSQHKSWWFAVHLAQVDAADVYTDIKHSKPQLLGDSFVVAAKR